MINLQSPSLKPARLALFWLALGVAGYAGWQASQQVMVGLRLAQTRGQLAIDPADRRLAQSLAPLGKAPLPVLADSLSRLSQFQPELGKLTWQVADKGQDSSPAQPDKAPVNNGADRLGVFQSVALVFTGDLWEQIGFLRQFRAQTGSYVAIDSLSGTATTLQLTVRVYGQGAARDGT